MAKVKFDVSGSNADEAARIGTLESPRPGIYRCKVKEANPGFAKDDNGKPDRSRPNVEVIYQVAEGKYAGSQLWQYLTFGEGFPRQKYDQFLQAFGFASKRKRKGDWDTNAVINKTCLIRVRGGKNLSDEYRGEVAAVLKDDGRELEGDAAGEGGDWDGGESFEDENGEEELGDDEEMTEEERRDQLKGMTAAELKAIAKEMDIPLSGKKKADVIDAIIEAELEGDDELLEDEDESMEDEGEYLSEDDLKAMDIPTLKETALQFDIETKGKKKSAVIAEILEAQAAPEGDSDEEPF